MISTFSGRGIHMKIYWVTLRVADLEKSVQFYTGFFGLEIASRFGSPGHQIVMLGKENETKIELLYEMNVKVEDPGKGISIGLEVQQMEELVKRLEDEGYNAVGPISPNPNLRFYFVKDPDGYTVQLVEQK